MDKLKSLADFYETTVDALLSPDPMVLTIHHAQGTQVGNGLNARFVQHVVSEEFVKEVFNRMDKHMSQQEILNSRLIDLLERFSQSGNGGK